MSGRPADPSYTVEAFAPDANYPAGAETWSSNPCKVAPPGAASVGFTPGQGNAAQYHNYLHNRRYAENANAKSAIAAVLTFVGQAPAMHFPTRTSGPAAATQNGAFYDKATAKWYVLANTANVWSSVDAGASWGQETGVSGLGSEHTQRGDADTSGNVVVTTDTRYVFALNASTSTWTKVDVAGAVITRIGHVAWTPANGGRWVHSIADLGWRTSTDRATWTAATTAPTGTWTAAVMGVAANKTSGRVVAMGIGTAGFLKVAYTDDGGVNWTTLADLTSTIASPSIASLSHNADEGAWYFTVGETSGAHSCEVWRSTDDGATWTKMATLANYCVRRIAGFGALLVGVASSSSRNDVVYSLDGGATWQKSGIWAGGSLVGVYAGGGRPMILTSAYCYMGFAMGEPSLGSLT